AHNNLGIALQAKGLVDEAIAEYRKAIEIDPKDAKAHTNLGGALLAKGRPDAALAEYQNAIEIDPKLAPAHDHLGHALPPTERLPGKGRAAGAQRGAPKAHRERPQGRHGPRRVGASTAATGSVRRRPRRHPPRPRPAARACPRARFPDPAAPGVRAAAGLGRE